MGAVDGRGAVADTRTKDFRTRDVLIIKVLSEEEVTTSNFPFMQDQNVKPMLLHFGFSCHFKYRLNLRSGDLTPRRLHVASQLLFLGFLFVGCSQGLGNCMFRSAYVGCVQQG